LGRYGLDSGVDRVTVGNDNLDDRAGQLAGGMIGLGFRKLPFEDCGRRALAELRLEHGRQRHPPPGSL